MQNELDRLERQYRVRHSTKKITYSLLDYNDHNDHLLTPDIRRLTDPSLFGHPRTLTPMPY